MEALTNSESDYEDSIWYRYDRPDGAFNCTSGGKVETVFDKPMLLILKYILPLLLCTF